MTVSELVEILSTFDDDAQVGVRVAHDIYPIIDLWAAHTTPELPVLIADHTEVLA